MSSSSCDLRASMSRCRAYSDLKALPSHHVSCTVMPDLEASHTHTEKKLCQKKKSVASVITQTGWGQTPQHNCFRGNRCHARWCITSTSFAPLSFFLSFFLSLSLSLSLSFFLSSSCLTRAHAHAHAHAHAFVPNSSSPAKALHIQQMLVPGRTTKVPHQQKARKKK